MDSEMFIVRGTGYSIDGTIVVIQGVGSDGYMSVRPYNTDGDVVLPLKIHKKFLQKFNERTTFNYTIQVTKLDNNTGRVLDESVVIIEKSFKDANTSAIIEFVDANIRPLLTME